MPKVVDISVIDTGKFRITFDKQTGVVTVVDKETGKMVTPDHLLDQTKESVFAATSAMPYILAVIGMAVLGVAVFVIIISILPAVDLTLLGGIVFGFITLATTNILNLIKAQEIKAEAREAKIEARNAKIQSAESKAQAIVTHEAVNSRMDAQNKRIDEALSKAVDAALAKGKEIGRAESEQRTDDLQQKRNEAKIQESVAIPPPPVPPSPTTE